MAVAVSGAQEPEEQSAAASEGVRPLSGGGLVALSSANVAVAYGVVFSFPVFLPVLVDHFHASRGTVAAAFSWAMFMIGITSLLVGNALDRWGPRWVFCAGALALAVGMGLAALAQSVWLLYVGFGLGGGMGASLLGWVSHGALLGRARLARPATAIGIVYGGMGVGPLITSPVAQRLIAAFGWRWALATIGVTGFVVLVALNICFHPPGPPAHDPGETAGIRSGPGQGPSLQWALRTPHFWLYFLAFFAIGGSMYAVLAHEVAYVVDRGFTPMFAASVFGVTQVLSGAGRVLFGFLADRWRRDRLVVTSFVMSIGGIGCLLMVQEPGPVAFLYAFVALFGVSFGARGPIMTAMAAGHFGGPAFGTIFGSITLAHGLGTALGPWAAGFLFDRTGDYRVTFTSAMLSLAVACAATLILHRLPRPSRVPR